MTGQQGEPGFVSPELVAGDLAVVEEDLAGQAHRLGQQHRSAAVTPFGDVEHVYWEAGSAGLLDALGVGVSHYGKQRSWTAALDRDLLRRARGPRARGRRSRLMTVSISRGIFVTCLITAEGGGSHSG